MPARKAYSGDLTADEERKKAKDTCFDLLAVRQRSVDELRKALRRKGFSEEVSEELLAKLDQAGLVDDASFAESWVRSRHEQQGLSKSALVAELKQKGVDGSIAMRAAESVGQDNEEERARQLVRKRLRSMTNLNEQTAVRRLLGMLGRKGYPQGLAYTVVREELRSAGAESTMLDDVATD